MGNETLLKLEAVVQKMLGNINELKSEKSSLESQLQEKTSKIEELENMLASATSDQEDVSARVSSLISSIEEWEKSEDDGAQGNDQDVQAPEPALEGPEGKQEAQLFDMGE